MAENPPAFPFQPVTVDGEPNAPEYGMTLRDWFAGQALTGMLAMRWSTEWPTAAAEAYALADAMLTERTRDRIGGGE